VITNPRPLTTAEALLLCVGAALLVGYAAYRRRQSLSVVIASALLATVVVTAPFTAWSVIRDARQSRHYSAWAAARVGPEGNGVDTSVIERAATVIPRDATYELFLSPADGFARDGVFRLWALQALLPRVAVEDQKKAQWVVAFGAQPSSFGVHATDVHWLKSARDPKLAAWVGRVQ
jgi:hypothetical protein